MPKTWTKRSSFEYFGTVGTNPIWSWSARSDDGKTVVLILWKDMLDYSVDPITFNCFGDAALSGWKDKPGNKERAENLKWARDHCDGRFRVIIAVAKDPSASPREILECYPHDRLIMKLIDLDEETGEFIAHNVGT